MHRWRNYFMSCAIALIAACSAPPSEVAITEAECQAQPGFVFVPGGEFIAGSDRAERDYGYRLSAAAIAATPADQARVEQVLRDRRWFEGERDRQAVSLPAFCIQANLVTQQDYAAFVAATGHRVPDISAAAYQEQGFLVHPYTDVLPYRWQAGSPPPAKLDHPVVLVAYADALAYAAWRGEQDGATYRLPTALEWEKAARGTDGRYFPWGNEWQADATQWGQSTPAGTAAIARYPLSRSPYGVEDMAGNVFEFTATRQPRQGNEVVVMKGCSWDDLPGFCRAAYAHTRPPTARHILFGFRLVKIAQSSRPR